jgi:hypothetical protein
MKIKFYDKSLKMNKKGFILSIWWFVMALIIATVIYITTIIFYQSPIDTREIEVNSLINHIADCIYSAGNFNQKIDFGKYKTYVEDENFLEENCHLNLFDVNNPEENQYFIKVNIYKLESVNGDLKYEDNLILSFLDGNKNFEEFCNIQIDTKNVNLNLPYCLKKKFYAFSSKIMSDNSRNEYIVEIIGGINKLKENVKQ